MTNNSADLDNSALVDHDHCACLCDAGAPGYAAITGIRPDGSTLLLFAETERIGDRTTRFDPNCRDAPHEQLGPLPARWRDRVQLAPIRCGRRTLRGSRCRIPVTQPGQACGHHRAQSAADADVRDERNTR